MRLVGPPRDQYQTWCASQKPGGRSQPGCWQCRSRVTSARQSLSGTVLCGAADVDDVAGPVGDDPVDLTITRQPSNVARESRPTCSASARRSATRSGSSVSNTLQVDDGAQVGKPTPPFRRPWCGRGREIGGRSPRARRLVSRTGPWYHRPALEFGLHGVEGGHDDLARLLVERPVHPHPARQTVRRGSGSWRTRRDRRRRRRSRRSRRPRPSPSSRARPGSTASRRSRRSRPSPRACRPVPA